MFGGKTGAAALSVVSNGALVLLKLVVAVLTGSVSVLSEALHSGIDLLASVIATLSVRAADRPADDRHQFGHGKVESISGVVQGLLIFLGAALIVWEAVARLLEGTHATNVDLGVAVMALSVLVNYLVGRYLHRVARESDSVALEANAWHLTADVYTSLGVLVGLALVRITHLGILDSLLGIGVAFVILKAAYDITLKSARDLLDASLPDDERQRIAEIIDQHSPRFVEYHELRSRKSGSQRHVDLHLVVDSRLSVEKAHELCDHLEEEIEREVGPITLVIHVEPDRRPGAPSESPRPRQ